MTCNFVERIIDPLQSRCQVLKIVPPSKKDVAKHLAWILDEESIKFKLEDLKNIVNQYYPDLRKCINTIQLNSKTGELLLDKTVIISSNYINDVINELTKPNPQFKTLRQIIANSNQDSFEDLYRSLFDRASEYLPGNEGTVAILVNEHQYKDNFRIDKEINIISLLQNLIDNK
jgi:DNA polymerase III delta prime subunit